MTSQLVCGSHGACLDYICMHACYLSSGILMHALMEWSKLWHISKCMHLFYLHLAMGLICLLQLSHVCYFQYTTISLGIYRPVKGWELLSSLSHNWLECRKISDQRWLEPQALSLACGTESKAFKSQSTTHHYRNPRSMDWVQWFNANNSQSRVQWAIWQETMLSVRYIQE